MDGHENVDELAGLNLVCSGEQLEQLLCASSKTFEPVSMTTLLSSQIRCWPFPFVVDKVQGDSQ